MLTFPHSALRVAGRIWHTQKFPGMLPIDLHVSFTCCTAISLTAVTRAHTHIHIHIHFKMAQ